MRKTGFIFLIIIIIFYFSCTPQIQDQQDDNITGPEIISDEEDTEILKLLEDLSYSVTDYDISYNSSGDCLVVFKHFNGSYYNIYACNYNTVSGWSFHELLQDNYLNNIQNYSVSLNENGNGLAVFLEEDNSHNYYYVLCKYDSISGWSSGEIIEQNADQNGIHKIVINNNDEIIFTWTRSSSSTNDDFLSRYYDPITGWSQYYQISSIGTILYFDIDIDNNGNAIAVWYSSSDYKIHASNFSNDQGWINETIFEILNDNGIDNLKLKSNSSGITAAVWKQYISRKPEVMMNVYTPGIGWEGHKTVSNTLNNADNPNFDINENGEIFIVWQQNDNDYNNIYGSFYDINLGLTQPILMENLDNDADFPNVSINDNGNVVIVWEHFDGSYLSIYKNDYSKNADPGTEVLLERSNHNSTNPMVMINNNNECNAFWLNQYIGTYNNLLTISF